MKGVFLLEELELSSIKSMGFGFTYKYVMKDRRLPVEAKAIYSYISSYAGAGNTAFPGWKLICYDLNVSKDRYYRYMTYLKAYGYITSKQKVKSDFTFGNNVYTLQEFPEQFEDKELIKEFCEEEVKKKRKPPKKKTDSPSSGTGVNTPIPDTPETEHQETDIPQHQETNSNTLNIDLYLIYDIWEQTCSQLQKEMTEVIYNDFINTLKPKEIKDNVFVFAALDVSHQFIVDVRYKGNIFINLQEICKAHSIQIDDIEIIV
jgi:hypothetical protein